MPSTYHAIITVRKSFYDQVLRTVARQAAELATEKMEGIEVILNDNDLTDIQVGTSDGTRQCCGSGSGRIRNYLQDPGTDP